MAEGDLAILFSGGTDSLSLYALAALGHHPGVPRPAHIHLLCMQNGMTRFPGFPPGRFRVTRGLLAKAAGPAGPVPASYSELDCGRLFQGLWLDRYEEWMPRYGGKNLVCVACKLAMHTRAVLYCRENRVDLVLAGYAGKQGYYPEQTPAFMQRVAAFSEAFEVACGFPLFEDFDHEDVTRHLLEDMGLPSTGGGERKCLFSQTRTTATGAEIGRYLDDMIPVVSTYLEHKLAGRVREAAALFAPPPRP